VKAWNFRLRFQKFYDVKFYDDMEWKEWLMLNLKNSGSVNEVHCPLIFVVALDNFMAKKERIGVSTNQCIRFGIFPLGHGYGS
jgi:hypothetical protein